MRNRNMLQFLRYGTGENVGNNESTKKSCRDVSNVLYIRMWTTVSPIAFIVDLKKIVALTKCA